MNPWDVCGTVTHSHNINKVGKKKKKKKNTPKTEILNNNKIQMLTTWRINEIFLN